MTFQIAARLLVNADIIGAGGVTGPTGPIGPEGMPLDVVPYQSIFTADNGTWAPTSYVMAYTQGVDESILTLSFTGSSGESTSTYMRGTISMPVAVSGKNIYGVGFIWSALSPDDTSTWYAPNKIAVVQQTNGTVYLFGSIDSELFTTIRVSVTIHVREPTVD